MNNRERVKAILHYENYDCMPIVHFGFWQETMEKWCSEGHLPKSLVGKNVYDNEVESLIAEKLGFDFGWGGGCGFSVNSSLFPAFESKIVETTEDGYKKVLNHEGVVVLQKDGAESIPTEVDHLLKDRNSWEEYYLPKLKYVEKRLSTELVEEIKNKEDDGNPFGLFCGSLFGGIRNWLGVVGVSYLYMDDEELYKEIIDTVGELTFKTTKAALATGLKFDYAHFWEDICYKNGPLVIPDVFDKLVGPHYKKISKLLNDNGVDIISLDCDGLIDYLIPTWIKNGVNTMFPIEVGTWHASIEPWREQYGKGIRGVGGMDKKVFAHDYKAIDAEIERLKKLIDLGGYIPCPDHRIPPDAKWENVQYCCDKMKKVFGC